MSDDVQNLLNSLSPEEYEATMRVLQEISNKGESDTLTNIYRKDYLEVPVSIDEFVESPNYAGWYTNNGKDIYPFWREKLREIFAPDSNYSEIAVSGCLSGDTVIPLLSGKKLTMKELADIRELDEYVYSFDLDENKYTPGHLVKAFSTGIKKVYEITLDNGEKFKATSNHRFLTRDKHWKSIDSGLSVNDSLMPLNLEFNEKAIEYNHRIISIDLIGEEEVFDLTVEKYHNFALECGIIAHNSIGTGKSHISVISLAYCLYKLMCLRDPHEYYGIAKGGYIYIVFFNATLQLSQGVAYTKFQSLLRNSPWFMERGVISGKKYLEYIPNGPIRFTVGSQMEHSIGKDIICLTGDTLIHTENGIEKLEDLNGEYRRVYSVDDSNNIILSDPALICLTKTTNELYEIELEDGSIIKCTGEHRLMLKDGSYKMAKDLTTDDELFEVDNKINYLNC